MSVDEFTEWQLLDAMSPIGGLRQDVNAGRIAQAIAIYSGHCTKAPELLDCMLQYDVREPELSPEQQARARDIDAAFMAARVAAQQRARERKAKQAAEAKRLMAEQKGMKRGNHRKTRHQA